ncbi:MAG: glycosyltransferase family 2 protein [Planctomycetota bacterium]|jgi:glycosyltransferase involved in cell wall biosynthesis
MKVSIVTSVLDSHKMVERQIHHYNKMNLPEDVEVIYVDDGSDPPINVDHMKKNFSFRVIATNDKRKWTQPAARNTGAKHARGKFLLMADLDHIVTMNLVNSALNCKVDVIRFNREVAVIDEFGEFTQDRDVLEEYGYIFGHPKRDGVKIAAHGNSYIIRRDLYLECGGVDERYVGTGRYPNREEILLKRKLKRLEEQGSITIWQDRTKPTIYMIPNGRYCGHRDYNPFGLFHNLSRKTNKGTSVEQQRRKTNKEKRRERRRRRK